MARRINAVTADTYYVALDGDDTWSGTLPEPNADGTDGPFAGVEHARDVIRQLLSEGRINKPTTVYLRGGRYKLDKPLVFEPSDSGPITYAAYEDETPILDGARPVQGWRVETVNGVACWVVELPEVAEGHWYFRSLYVNGLRRPRARLPKQGLYRVADVPGMTLPGAWGDGGYKAFRLGKGDFKSWKNLTDIDIVLFHWWIDERFPVAAFDPDTEQITSSRESRAPLTEAQGETMAPCYVENVFEALSQPGEWYLDRDEGKLYYVPLPGETPENTDVFAPTLFQLMRLEGDPEAGRYVEWLRFDGIQFEHSDWVQPGPEVEHMMAAAFTKPGRAQYGRSSFEKASSSQGASDIPGAVYLEGARRCTLENCRIANIGWYGLQLADGCMGNHIVGNDIYDLGAGGIIMDGATLDEPPALRTGQNWITDNHIHECGRIFHSGIGILSMHSFGNTFSHNHIHDLYYSGISVGWTWGYAPQITRDNKIEKNHIHDLGQGLLSDMGGIYTLGVQPGTVIRGNLIHDIEKLIYGAWCIYPDEGSSHILIENNVCYRTNGEIFHQHYGRENIVRNNIFALGSESVAAHGRTDERHKAFSLERNIFITDGAPIFKGGYSCKLNARNHRSELNLFWDVSGKPLTFAEADGKTVDLDAWKELGYDRFSVVADPKCVDLEKDDFTLADNSPVFDLGFVEINVSDVGPRPG